MKTLTCLMLACALLPAASNARQRDIEAETVARNHGEFAFDLYRQLADQEGNLFFSPASISEALSLAYAGARGETAAQMRAVMHLELDDDVLHPASGRLRDAAQLHAGPNELTVANRLWIRRDYELLEDYLTLTREHYGAQAESLDFAADPQTATGRINSWVVEQTHGRIQDLIPAALPPTTTAVLTNAIYFKGKWAYPFEPSRTKQEPFFLSDGTRIDVPLMRGNEDLAFTESTGEWKLLVLPYEGYGLEMVLILPDQPDGLPALEAQLDHSTVTAWCDMAWERSMRVWLPRFRMETSVSLRMVLQGMGMVDAFSGAADFSGITDQSGLLIEDALHKAFVQVDEEGTEAAAATGMFLLSSSEPPPPAEFRAEHPFVLLIRDRHTESILFLGRVVLPG